MKQMNPVVVLFLISLVGVYTQQTCRADYECNSIPYGVCSGSLDDCSSLLPGLAVDEVNKVIYYTAQCRPAASDNSSYSFPNATIKRINIAGSVPTDIYKTIYYPAPNNINRIYTVVNNLLYFDRTSRAIANPLIAFNLSFLQETYPNQQPGAFQSKLDIGSGYSFTCQYEYNIKASYSIFRYQGVLGQTSTQPGTRLYSFAATTPCGPVKTGRGSDLIMTTINYLYSGQTTEYITSFYRGTIGGGGGSVFLFNVSGYVNDFDVVQQDGSIVYATSNGLFRRVGTTVTVLNNEAVSGVYVSSQTIYYNNGRTIKSMALGARTANTLIQQSTGRCECRYGFSGSGCSTCNGQIQYNNYDGIPSCVPLNEQGLPVRCSFDYQCGNVPFSVCYGSCNCRTNFTGSRCDQCAAPRNIVYRDGIPYCE